MSKKSSVEQLDLDIYIWFTLMGVHFPIEIKNAIERAKAMHKKEIEDAQSYAISNADMTNNKGYFDCEKYYNETYIGGDDE